MTRQNLTIHKKEGSNTCFGDSVRQTFFRRSRRRVLHAMAAHRIVLPLLVLGESPTQPALFSPMLFECFTLFIRHFRVLEPDWRNQLGDPPHGQGGPPLWQLYISDQKTYVILSPQSSSSSGFYILNDYQDTFAEDSGSTSAFPATAVSNIMLKTLGILRVYSMPCTIIHFVGTIMLGSLCTVSSWLLV